MEEEKAIAVIGTFDSKAEEHLFLRDAIEQRGFKTVMVHLGTKGPSPFKADLDLYAKVIASNPRKNLSRDEAIVDAIRQGLRPDISVIESDSHINAPAFGRQAAEIMHSLVQQSAFARQ